MSTGFYICTNTMLLEKMITISGAVPDVDYSGLVADAIQAAEDVLEGDEHGLAYFGHESAFSDWHGGRFAPCGTSWRNVGGLIACDPDFSDIKLGIRAARAMQDVLWGVTA